MAQQIDWSGIRAASVAIGVRAAARAACHHLPDIEQIRFINRVLQRSHREGWVVQKDASILKAQSSVISQAKPLSSNVIKGAQIIENTLENDSKATRLSLSIAAKRMSREAESAGLDQARNAHEVAKLANTVYGWEAKQQASSVVINLAILGL